MTRTLLLLTLITLFSCKREARKVQDAIESQEIELKYAKGFTIADFGTYKILEVKNPWPKANKSYRYQLFDNGKQHFEGQDNTVEGVLTVPVEKIVITSTTHIPALELLGMEKTLIGFPGTEYISSETIRQRIDNGFIRELGKNEGINTEVLLELNPEVVIAFGIDGNNKAYETIKKSNIPVIFNGDWTPRKTGGISLGS